jgi:hypothetical protein
MTKKDYELIASEIRKMPHIPLEIRETGKRTLYREEMFANSLATRLEEDNPRFDRTRFLEACGFKEESYLDGFSIKHNK